MAVTRQRERQSTACDGRSRGPVTTYAASEGVMWRRRKLGWRDTISQPHRQHAWGAALSPLPSPAEPGIVQPIRRRLPMLDSGATARMSVSAGELSMLPTRHAIPSPSERLARPLAGRSTLTLVASPSNPSLFGVVRVLRQVPVTGRDASVAPMSGVETRLPEGVAMGSHPRWRVAAVEEVMDVRVATSELTTVFVAAARNGVIDAGEIRQLVPMLRRLDREVGEAVDATEDAEVIEQAIDSYRTTVPLNPYARKRLSQRGIPIMLLSPNLPRAEDVDDDEPEAA